MWLASFLVPSVPDRPLFGFILAVQFGLVWYASNNISLISKGIRGNRFW